MFDKLIEGAVKGLAASGNSAGQPMMQIIGALLSNGGPYGGLSGLVQQFNQAGFGQQVASWISTGQNLPITADDLSKVFGGSQLQQMAASAGMDASQFGGQLSQLLPQLIDQMTPQGQLPAGGAEDALTMLSKMFSR